jgi:beta-galactosidase
MVTFEPGTIKAVCTGVVLAGNVQPLYELHTAGKADRISLTVDKTRLTNDWNDVVFVTATVVDANGVPVPDADNLISFDATGAGKIVAVDSADNTDHDPFQATKRRAFQGRCLAYIKADRSSGTITVAASAEGLQSNKFNITVTK